MEARGYYESKKQAADAAYARAVEWSGRYKLVAGLVALALVASFARAVRSNNLLAVGLELLALVGCGVLLLRERRRADAAGRVSALYQRGLDRLSGDSVQSGHTGEEFADVSQHLYARDLDVVGANSLFGMLATARTALGRRELAEWLLRSPTRAELQRRQGAVRELTGEFELRERVSLLGRTEFGELPADSFERWLQGDEKRLPTWLRPVLSLLTFAWLAVLVAGLLLHTADDVLLRNVLALMAVQGAVCLLYREVVSNELELTEKLPGQVEVLRAGLRLLRERGTTECALLRELQESAQGDLALKHLERLLLLVEQRSKEWYYLPALLLGVGTQAAAGLQQWKRAHGAEMRRWIEAWSAFDALVAVSTYAAERPQNVYPELLESDGTVARFEAEAMVHPLLRREAAVANDVALGEDTQVLLISGSNMAGKSTLLRAMGANVVLAFAGAPVCATAVRFSTLHVGASLALSDSLAEGRSKFLAEVERLRGIVAEAQKHCGETLFLIDEIFSGTNSADRKAAADAVVRSLVAAGALGAVSTHDLTLTALADDPAMHGRNVHMASRDEDDPLSFDYKLKDGVNRTTNALAIVRMLGLVKDVSPAVL